MKKTHCWDYCCGGENGGTKETSGDMESMRKKQNNAVSEAQEILSNWPGKYKNVQLIWDSQTSKEDRYLLLWKLKVESQPKTHEQPSKEVTQLSFLVLTTDL